MRGESQNAYSSFRLVVERAGVQVRLKQTLNDWWVPISNDVNLRRVEGHALLGDEVILLGPDYHRKPGACAQILGTTVEAYVQAGSLDHDGWGDVYGALEPAVPEVVAEARRTSFAERNYWMRFGRHVGPWDSHEFTRPQWMRPDPETIEKVAWASTPDVWAPMPGAPDSVAASESKPGREMQVLFRQPMTLNYSSWLRVHEPPDSDGPVARRDPRYPQRWKRTGVEGSQIESAALQPAAGPWFFSWQQDGRSWELHVRGRKGLDEAGAMRVLRSVLPSAST